jgi:hypothetical protein
MSRSDDYKSGYFAELARQVSRGLGRDNVRKQSIAARSPHMFAGMDAGEFAAMSSRELAKRELDALGIKPDDRSIEEQLLDAHHGGRAYARQGTAGGRPSSGMDGAGDSFVDRYLKDV